MSPEQARGVAVDERTDIWSLGVVLYEMVSGHPPFSGQTPTDVVIAVVEKEPPALSQYLAGDVPAELERIVRKACGKTRTALSDRQRNGDRFAESAQGPGSDAQLDRSIAPAFAGGTRTVSGKPIGPATGTDQAINTDQLQAMRVTTVVRLRRRGGAYWPLRLGWLR